MASSKPPIKKYVLTTEIGRVKAKHPDFLIALPEVETTDADGKPVTLQKRDISVPPSQRWSDAVLNLSQHDAPAAGRELIGAEAYNHFIAAGGSATLLFEIAGEHSKSDLGESQASDGS